MSALLVAIHATHESAHESTNLYTVYATNDSTKFATNVAALDATFSSAY